MMFKRMPYLMNDDDGKGGGGAVDRGDEIKIAAAAADKAADEAAAAEAAAAEAAEAEALAAAAAKGDEGDGEPARGPDGKFAKKDDKDEARIPKSRFDDAVAKERQAREAAEGRLAELQAQLKTVDRNADNEKLETEITDLEAAHAKFMLDGEVEKAAAAMRDIRMKERQIGISSNAALTEQAKEQAREEMRMELTIERLETTYEEFNPEHENFDPGLVEMVLAMQRHKIGQGISPSKALISAAADVMKRMHTDGGKGDPKGLAAATKANDRKADQVKKNLDAAKSQPGDLKNAGKDSDKGGEALTWSGTKEEFDAMPDSTKAKLRGDTI
jgi:hypothetical protein